MNSQRQYTGLAASPGIAVGPVWIYRQFDLRYERYTVEKPEAELTRLRAAIDRAREELQSLEARAREHIGEEEAAIFEAHQMFLEDPELTQSVEGRIRQERLNAEAAVYDATEVYAGELEQVENEYFQARAADIRDVAARLIRCLLGVTLDDVRLPRHPVVILAEDLTPSDTVQFDKNVILGVITSRGGPTSHTAILARSLGIPAVVSVPIRIEDELRGAMAILDALAGTVTIHPGAAELKAAEQKRGRWLEKQSSHLAAAGQPAITTDGRRVEVVANIGSVEDARVALNYGAEGVGLFRTEFLFLDRNTMPTEEEQFSAYRDVFKLMGKRPVVVRTFDIGGDKAVPYMGFPEELNPFLGWRGIRMMDRHADALETQFRALLRAGGGTELDLRIMVPMVSGVEEVQQSREVLEKARESLRRAGKPCAEGVQFGIMVEVPSAALIADRIAEYVDFFSIGTNDLTQYTLAADRTNAHVAHMADTFHPAVLTLIEHTIRAAHDRGRWVGLCGEFAGKPLALPILLGLGLDEFSMAAPAIPTIKACVRGLSHDGCQHFVRDVMAMRTPGEVRAACERFMAPVLV